MQQRQERLPPSGNAAHGFTLIELVTVVAIIAITAAIAIPRFGNSLARIRVERAAHRITSDLSLAQQHARATSASQPVQFQCGDDNCYALPGVRDIDHSTAKYQVNLSESPYGATLVAAKFGGDAEIIFDGYGMPDSGGSIVVQVADHLRMITINAETGQATVSELALAEPVEVPLP